MALSAHMASMFRRALHTSALPVRLSAEVAAALESSAASRARAPIVALETALVTHGLPAPLNVRTASSLEQIVRANGAVPATIGAKRTLLSGTGFGNQQKRHYTAAADTKSSGTASTAASSSPGYVVVIGASMFDTMLLLEQPEANISVGSSTPAIYATKSYPGVAKYAAGGVARNISDCIARCGTKAVLLTAVGQDANGDALMEYMNEINVRQAEQEEELIIDEDGVARTVPQKKAPPVVSDGPMLDLSHVKRSDRYPTASYYSILKPSGEFLFGVTSSSITQRITSDYIIEKKDIIEKARLLVLDTNIPISTIASAVDLAIDKGVPVWLEPTATQKSLKVFTAGVLEKLFCITPNYKELITLVNHLHAQKTGATGTMAERVRLRDTDKIDLDSLIKQCLEASKELVQLVPNIIVKLGPYGILLVRREIPTVETTFPLKYEPVRHPSSKPVGKVTATHYAAYPTLDAAAVRAWGKGTAGGGPKASDIDPGFGPGAPHVVNSSGAGDCLVGGIANAIVRGWIPDTAIKCGLRAANLSVQSLLPVPEFINKEELSERAVNRWATRLKVTKVL